MATQSSKTADATLQAGAILQIWRTSQSGYEDYSNFVWAEQGQPVVSKTHRLNEPQILTFALHDGLAGFNAPEAGNRVRYANGIYPADRFIGYLSTTPERVLLGRDSSGNPVYGYRCEAIDESLRLEWNTARYFPTLPPFVNKYQGQIVTELITLLGGGLDTTNVDNGILIPYFRVRPEEGFWDAVRRLSDNAFMAFWISSGRAYYKAYDNAAFPYSAVEVAPQGPNNPTAAINVTGPGSNWNNPTRVYTSNDSYAGGSVFNTYTDLLRATGFGFSIPVQATIIGVVVEIERSGSAVGVQDLHVYLVAGGAEGGTDHAMADIWPTTDVYKTYGTSLDTWGFALTPTDVNASNFGVSVSAHTASGNPDWAYIDHIRMTVYYSMPFDSADLRIAPVAMSIYNDVIAVGQIEPQAYAREYFVGDGLTASFPLYLPVWGAESSKLLEDDFAGTSIDTTRWTETDPTNSLAVSVNSLAFVCSPTASKTFLSAKQGLEIAGKLELRAGRIRFNAASDCIIGGVFSSDTGILADCIAGFSATPSGTSTLLKAIVSGSVVSSPSYIVTSGKTYQFVLTLECGSAVRRRREFHSLTTTYGGADIVADAVATFTVTELPDEHPDDPTRVLEHTTTIASIPYFLFYSIVAGPQTASNSVNLNLNFCLLRKAINVQVFSAAYLGATWKPERLGDKADPEARASLVTGTEGYELGFFADRQPAAKELIQVVYRVAGQAKARVRRDSSVTDEAAKSGDTGVRAGALPSVEPAPRDAIELETAIQAYIDDHTTVRYEGTWTFDTKSYPNVSTEPVPGQFLTVNCPTRHPSFAALVTEVKSDYQVYEQISKVDIIEHSVKYGPLYRLEALQKSFAPPENAMVGAADTVTDVESVEFNSVGTNYATDRPDAKWSGTITSGQVNIDAGVAPTSCFELRKTDAAWGTASTLNSISSF